MIGEGELVIFGLGDPAGSDAQALPKSQLLAVEIALQVRVEELVVAELVGSDALTDRTQHWLLGRLRERRVVGTGASLDDATCDQFAGARAAHRARGGEVDAEAGGEPGAGIGVIEIGIGEGGPASEREAMLDLLLAPGARHALKLRIVREHVAEIMCIVAAILLHQAGGFHDAQNLGIDLAQVEFVPADVVQRPGPHEPQPFRSGKSIGRPATSRQPTISKIWPPSRSRPGVRLSGRQRPNRRPPAWPRQVPGATAPGAARPALGRARRPAAGRSGPLRSRSPRRSP